MTPMMQQYQELAKQHHDCILLFRLGDFYEIFFDDAITAASILGVQLTRRPGAKGEKDTPMCGIPWHQLDNYLPRLIKEGYKVALCEQLETPEEAKQKRGYKAVVKRSVVRIITAATLLEDNLLPQDKIQHLTSIHKAKKGNFYLAWADISTGDISFSDDIDADQVIDLLAQIRPSEILITEDVQHSNIGAKLWQQYNNIITIQPKQYFQVDNAESAIKTIYDVASITGLAQLDKEQICAVGSLCKYFLITQKNHKVTLKAPLPYFNNDYVRIDNGTIKNLDIFTGTTSLFKFIKQTQTTMGSRLLQQWLSYPLYQHQRILDRQDSVQFLLENDAILTQLRKILGEIPDGIRSLSRIVMKRGGPRDLGVIQQVLELSEQIRSKFDNNHISPTKLLGDNIMKIPLAFSVTSNLSYALKSDESLPLHTRDGGFVKRGYHPSLDEFYNLIENSREHLKQLEAKFREITQISTLKIKQNNVIGYFIEVQPKFADVMVDKGFTHRQSLASTIRFGHEEINELQKKLLGAEQKITAMEQDIFDSLALEVNNNKQTIYNICDAIAIIDCCCAFAKLVELYQWIKPNILPNSQTLQISGGYHPIVKAMLEKQMASFTCNDCVMNNDKNGYIHLLTGPNMAGKSTYLRQNAIILLLAHIGCYVPAQNANIGMVDAIFSRIGASDDITRGYSTFMVEMQETAYILNQATKQSFVILDEVGRGTATYDGMAIAQACVEYLHNNNKCRTIFATHYHELNSLTNDFPCLKPYHLKVEIIKDDINFLHQVAFGAAYDSYGIFVAKKAGIPKSVVNRASKILSGLQSDKTVKLNKKESMVSDNTMPLFN
jgi:DNA mismatch repair protein MutS